MGSAFGHIISMFGTKGGVGRTTLAANLAVSFGLNGFKAVIVDFDLTGGAVEQVLGLKPEKSIDDVFKDEDFSDLLQYLTVYDDNVSLLASPVRPDLSLSLEPALAGKILSNLKEFFDFVIVDIPATFDGHTLTALEMSDFVALLVENDILSAKAAVFSLQNLALLGYQLQTIYLVVNKFSTRGMSLDEVKEAVGIPVFWRIDNDKTFVDSLNKLKPFVIEKTRAQTSLSIKRLALTIAAEFGKVRGHK